MCELPASILLLAFGAKPEKLQPVGLEAIARLHSQLRGRLLQPAELGGDHGPALAAYHPGLGTGPVLLVAAGPVGKTQVQHAVDAPGQPQGGSNKLQADFGKLILQGLLNVFRAWLVDLSSQELKQRQPLGGEVMVQLAHGRQQFPEPFFRIGHGLVGIRQSSTLG